MSDGKNLYMQRIKLDGALKRLETPELTTLGDLDMGGLHLLATGGFLDDSGFDRIFWMHTTRWPGFYYTVQAPKSGQLIVFDHETTYSLSYFYRRHALSPQFVPGEEGYLLFADRSDNEPILVGKDGTPAAIQWLPAGARSRAKYDIANQSVDKEKGVGFTRAAAGQMAKDGAGTAPGHAAGRRPPGAGRTARRDRTGRSVRHARRPPGSDPASRLGNGWHHVGTAAADLGPCVRRPLGRPGPAVSGNVRWKSNMSCG